MQRLEVSCAVRHIYTSLGAKGLNRTNIQRCFVFRPVEVLAEFADGPAVCVEEATGGCSFACNFNVTRSAVFTVTERRNIPNMALSRY